jgi:DNA repair exonuclease SbcCD ATPase subunit
MLKIQKLRYMNFLSTGNQFIELDLASHQKTLVVGNNGSGKSTILDALCYVLYNKSFRKINKPQLCNTITGKNCLVEVEFSIHGREFLVRRGMKPNVFEIIQDGVLLNQDAALKDYQEVLEKQILRMNLKSFSQIIVLGSASYTPFMRLPAASRREIIEDVLDLQVFSKMNVLLKERIQGNREEIQAIENDLRMLENQISLQEKNRQKSQSSFQEIMILQQSKIKEYRAEIDQKTHQIAEFEAKSEQLSAEIRDQKSLLKKQQEFSELRKRLDSRQRKIKREVEFYNSNQECPTCNQEISEVRRKDILIKNSGILQAISEGFASLDIQMNAIQTRMEEISRILGEIDANNQKISSLNVQINTTIRHINEIEEELQSIREKSETIQFEDTRTLDDLREKKAKAQVRKIECVEDREVLNASAILLKDGGIKTKIIRQYIPIINTMINKYLSAMQFMIQFELNEEFEEKIMSRYRDEFSYESFSEGERARVDLAVLFAWRATARMRNSSSSNLLIMDEVFDGSLDSAGADEVITILDSVAPESNIIVISHKEQYLEKFDRIIKFSKKKNCTVIQESA